MNLFRVKPERPYLKVCTQCHGKGQTSYFNNNQEKIYGKQLPAVALNRYSFGTELPGR